MSLNTHKGWILPLVIASIILLTIICAPRMSGGILLLMLVVPVVFILSIISFLFLLLSLLDHLKNEIKLTSNVFIASAVLNVAVVLPIFVIVIIGCIQFFTSTNPWR